VDNKNYDSFIKMIVDVPYSIPCWFKWEERAVALHIHSHGARGGDWSTSRSGYFTPEKETRYILQ